MKKGFYHPTAVIILAVITLSFALIFYINSKYLLKPPQPAPPAQVSPIPSPSPSPKQSPKDDLSSEASAKDETTTWKTYTNERLGFSLKYPPNFTSEDHQDFVQFRSNNIKFPTEESPIGEIIAGGQIIVTALQSEVKTLEELVNRYRANGSFEKFNKTKLDGVDSWELTFKPAIDYEIAKPLIISFYNGREYSIGVSTSKADKVKIEKIYDQILSTFKFLN